MEPFKKINNIILKPWFIISFILIILASYYWFDKTIAEYFYQVQMIKFIPGLDILSAIGKAMPNVLLLGLIALFFQYIYVREQYATQTWFLLLAVLIPNVACFFLKVFFGRARPELWINYQEYGFYWFKFTKIFWSFPSSHCSTVTGLFVGISMLFPKSCKYLIVPAVLLISTRIILYQHYLSDVLVASYLTYILIHILTIYIKPQAWFLKIKKSC